MGGKLEDLTDLKYQVFGHPEELCNAVQSGVKSGSLENVFLNAHGGPSSISLGAKKLMSVLRSLPRGCFAGMPRNAKLFLSCCFGGSGLVPLNIAEWFAAESGLPVYASKDYVNDVITAMSIQNQKEIDIDFCGLDDAPRWESACFDTDFKCTQSMTRVFHPPVTLFEKSVFTAKMGLSAFLGLFIAYELARIPLTALSLTGAILSLVRTKFL